jgi:hypothetical protein
MIIATLVTLLLQQEPLSPPPGPPPVTAELAANKFLFVQIDFTGLKLLQGGRTIEPGMFGGDALPPFEEVPDALEEAHAFRTKRIVGFSIGMAGVAWVVADSIWFLAAVLPSGNVDRLNATIPLYLALAIPALVLSAVGGLIQQSAVVSFFNAVNRFNAALLNLDPKKF